jgi:hypothetical protein
MDQKLWVFEVLRPSSGSQKKLLFFNFLGLGLKKSTTMDKPLFGGKVGGMVDGRCHPLN